MHSVAARIARTHIARPAVRPAAVTAARLHSTRHSYSTASSMHDNDPEVLEKEKKRNLSKEPYQTSAPIDECDGWNERLASASEANVKADRSDVSKDDLVKRTVNHLLKKHNPLEPEEKPEEKPEDQTDRREAAYDRDEVAGPLRGAGAAGSSGGGDIEEDTYEEEVEKVEGEWHRTRHTETHHVPRNQ